MKYCVILPSLAVLLISCRRDKSSVEGSNLSSEPSIMQQVSEKVRELASSSGFSDDDAIESAVFLHEKLVGPKREKDHLSARIAKSLPTTVSVFVSYGYGGVISTYEIKFSRGDASIGFRTAYFESLRYHPHE